MWGLVADRRPPPARVSRAGRRLHTYLQQRTSTVRKKKEGSEEQIRKMGSFHTSNIITLLCCWCPTSYGLLQSVRHNPYYFSSYTGIQLGHPRIENKIFKRVIRRIDTKSSMQTSSDTTTTNVNKINNLGSLLLSSTIGNSGANKVQLILASQSPRRSEILDMMGLKNQYLVIPSPLDEKALQNELTEREHALPPTQYAMILAEHKAKAVGTHILLLQNNGTDGEKNKEHQSHGMSNIEKEIIQYVIGSDTIVDVDGDILEKPLNEDEARNMLSRLSGRWHNVHTGVSIYSSTNNYNSPISSFTETAKVKFTTLTPTDIEAYIRTGDPMDKAGSYGIQGIGGQIVESIEGDFFAVMGLPMHRLSRELAKIINASSE